MVDLPWRSGSADDGDPTEPTAENGHALVRCQFQDGTVLVFEEEVRIERTSRSKFSDKRIPIAEIEEVVYAKRIVISYLQIQQSGVESADASRLSTPVDENTVHFGRGKRDCAKRIRDSIEAQMTVDRVASE